MKNPKESIEWAIGLAKDVPEEFQVVAFAELLRYSLNLISNTLSNPDLNKNNRSLPPLHNISNGLPDLHLLAKKGSRDQHVAWAVAELYARGEEINNESIRRIIKEYLAITPPVRQNTNRSLRDLTPKYIIRTKTGKKYFYTPSARLLEIFEGLEDTK
jgi:hypothetical protein